MPKSDKNTVYLPSGLIGAPPLSTISLRHSGTPRLSQGPYFDFSRQTSISSSEESHHLILFLTFVRKRIGEAAVLPVELSGRHRRRRRLRDLRRSENACHSPLSNYHGVQGSAKWWAPGCVNRGESIRVSSDAINEERMQHANLGLDHFSSSVHHAYIAFPIGQCTLPL